MNITFAGNEMALEGNQVKIGDIINDFSVTANDLSIKKLNDFNGIKVINVVPSLDTGVCDLQTKRFNQELGGSGINVLTISNDLPFAQARWCGASGLDNVVTLSDYLLHDFAAKFGTYIPNLGLQTRAVFVLDANNEVKFVDYVSEVTNHPDYEAAIALAKSL